MHRARFARGRSDAVPGWVTGREAAEDLHALLRSARIEGSYVLLGASLGGAISDLYAAAYPKDVAGMVLLDSTLPAYLDMYKRLFPRGAGPQPGEWKQEAEHLAGSPPSARPGRSRCRLDIPVPYIAAALSLPSEIETAIRTAQRAFVARFSRDG